MHAFEEALTQFDRAEFERAAAGFDEVIRLRGGTDGPSRFYLGLLPQLRQGQAPGSAWDGVVRLEAK